MTTILKIEQISKTFQKNIILKDVSMNVQEGEIFTILGPSGTGKTTLLRCITGLEEPTKGCLTMRGKPLNTIPTHARKIGMVFQSTALFPHMTVAQNIQYGLQDNDENHYKKLIKLIGMEKHAKKMPKELSGGQAQRVALAQSLAAKPDVILLDEPFAHLDASLRTGIRNKIKEILRKAKTTTIFVTHDQDEALSFSDRVAVLMDGEIQQIGTPDDIYARPTNKKVATFLGTANFIKGVRTNGGYTTELGLVKTSTRRNEKILEFFFRPETVTLKKDKKSAHRVASITYFGHDLLVAVKTAQGNTIHVRMLGPEKKVREKDTVSIKFLKNPRELA